MTKPRIIFSLNALRLPEGIALRVVCQNAPPKHEQVQKQMKAQFKKSLSRVLNFAKHETLRKLHRYHHAHKPLQGQDHPGASRTGFDPGELAQDLQSMLYGELPDMLQTAADSTIETLGAEPFTMPSQDVLDFIANRADLLSGLPEELYQRITDELSQGLSAGESLAELSDRISQAFDDIESGTAEVIADTETSAAFNYATNAAARSAGVEFKQWIHGGSRVPREDHLAIDGLVVPFDEPFPVGSPPLMFPHDPDGSPEDVINCSCVSMPATADQYQG
jgi:uncharacterized protein with gpF-like domain